MSSAHSRDTFLRIMGGLHHSIFKLTGGRIGSSIVGMPVVVLTTTGRKSGQPRTTMLTAPVEEDDKLVLVASKGGDDRHPLWYLNLKANPEVEVVVHRRKKRMLARVATAEEKSELWPRVTRKYRGYAGYQRKTSRDIPVVILEPLEQS